MRHWIWVSVFLIGVAAAYALSPFFGLYQLGSALHSRSAEEAISRIDIRSVRRSIISQVLDEGSRNTKLSSQIGDLGRRLAVSAAASALDRRLEEVFTAEILRRLIVEGSLPPEFATELELGNYQLVAPPGTSDGRAVSVSFGVPDNPLRFIQDWRFRSLKTFEVVVGLQENPEAWVGLTLRLRGSTWRLSGIELPDPLVERLTPIIKARIAELE